MRSPVSASWSRWGAVAQATQTEGSSKGTAWAALGLLMPLLIIAIAATSSRATAQDIGGNLLGSEIPLEDNRGANISVLDRERPEYAPAGIPVGAFMLNPSLDTGAGYLSNVFATPNAAKSDGYVIIDPTISGQSDWSRNSLTAAIGTNLREFFTYHTEDENGWFARVDGRVDLHGDAYIVTGGGVQKAYEEQDSADYPVGAAGAVGYVQEQAYLRAYDIVDRIRLVGATDFTHLAFDDVPQIGGGTLIQSDQDQSIGRFSGRGEYGLTPDISVFSQFTYTYTNYDEPLPGGVENRNSQEGRALLGTSFDITDFVRGQFGVGYVQRRYESAAFENLSGIAFDAKIEYFPTQLMTITIRAYRVVQDSIYFSSGGFFNNAVLLRVDHELLRNLLLYTQLGYNVNQFQGNNRTDHVGEVGFGAHYFLSRGLGLKVDALYIDRASAGTTPGPQFADVRAVLTVIVQR